jgi:hypothetical protein
MYFDIPLRLPNTEYKYGDLVAANEVYSPVLEVALADIRLSLAALTAFVDLGAGGTLTPFPGSKIKITGKTPVSDYPPVQSGDYVKATSTYDINTPQSTTNPDKPLTGSHISNSWMSENGVLTNQRFHVDLGVSKIVNRIYYENFHTFGQYTDIGAKNFILQGSNSETAFSELTFATDTDWTTIATGLQFGQHISSDQADPKYIDFTNTISYRYYAIKILDCWGTIRIGLRRIELQRYRSIEGYIKAAGTGGEIESQYPPAQDGTYVKATLEYDIYHAHYATDPATSLTGDKDYNSWVGNSPSNQRFHVDLGSPKVIDKIYYENLHSLGGNINMGAKNFILQGSNDPAAFAELTYGIDTNWITIQSGLQFDEHTPSDIADPKYITIANTTAYRYYAIKIADNWGHAGYTGLRRIELQVTPLSETGVTIVSTPGGSAQSWESEDVGFNRADPAGYTCQIYRSGHIYMCSTPGISGATPPDLDRSPGSLSTDGGVIWTQCTPPGMRFFNPCTFDANPRYGDYRRGKKYFQPMDKADGGDLYVYDKGLAAENARSIGWEKILPADLTRLLEFIEMVRGATYPFNFYDENGMVHQVRITNPGEIKSAPVSFNFEGGIAVELLFVNEPVAAETDEAYYADGTCFADGIIYAG